jgi:hypothetical protein
MRTIVMYKGELESRYDDHSNVVIRGTALLKGRADIHRSEVYLPVFLSVMVNDVSLKTAVYSDRSHGLRG